MAKNNGKGGKPAKDAGKAKGAAPKAAGEGAALNYDKYEAKMKATISVLAEEYATIRAGQASPAVLDRIRIDYYGSPTPLSQVANIAAPEPRCLTIQPWDASQLKAIEKAIQASDVGINPQNDGRVIRLVFPPLTEERRKELAKQVHKMSEDAKVAVRNVRRDAVDAFKTMKKQSTITEDDEAEAETAIQKLTDKYIKEIEDMSARKEKDLTAV